MEIEELKIIRSDGSESDLTTRINANACSHHSKRYFFESEDPIITFEGLNVNELREVQKMVVAIRYYNMGADALRICINQIMSDKNREIENLKKQCLCQNSQ